jgi:Cu2+-exporting ATPase
LAVEIDGRLAGVVAFRPAPRPKAASAIERLRNHSGLSVVLLSDRPAKELAARAAALGVSIAPQGLSQSAMVDFLRSCRTRGLRSAFVGDCRARSALAEIADVAISTSGDPGIEIDPVAAVLMRPGLDLFARLHEVACEHATRVQSTQRFVLLPNALCVAGALLLGVTALGVAVVSNLSTLGLYRNATEALHAPMAGAKARLRGRLISSLAAATGPT